MLAAAIAELRELQTASGRLFILRRRVIALFAYRALQCHDLTHLFILTDCPGSCPDNHFHFFLGKRGFTSPCLFNLLTAFS
jgi:hypothetical protein